MGFLVPCPLTSPLCSQDPVQMCGHSSCLGPAHSASLIPSSLDLPLAAPAPPGTLPSLLAPCSLSGVDLSMCCSIYFQYSLPCSSRNAQLRCCFFQEVFPAFTQTGLGALVCASVLPRHPPHLTLLCLLSASAIRPPGDQRKCLILSLLLRQLPLLL